MTRTQDQRIGHLQLAGEVFPLGYARKSSDANVRSEDRTLTVGEVPNLYDRTRQLDSDFIFGGMLHRDKSGCDTSRM